MILVALICRRLCGGEQEGGGNEIHFMIDLIQSFCLILSTILIWRNKCIILEETNTIPSLEGINDSMMCGIKIKNLTPDRRETPANVYFILGWIA